IARDPARVHILLESETALRPLGVRYDGTTTTVLDVYCAQAHHESSSNSPQIIADMDTWRSWFADFEVWFNAIKTWKVPKISVNSSTKIALFIAAATFSWKSPDEVSQSQWEDIDIFLTQGTAKVKQVLGIDYPIAKGKWTEHKRQIEKTFEVARTIARR